MFRWRSWCLFLGLSTAACGTKANPAATCMQGTCIDPAYPYCDTDGSISGTPGACIAVTCNAGEFGKCSGDSALMCNQYGTGYDEVTCAHGCDAATGCKLCEANQTVCANGAVATCDANGNQTSVTQCPLGCFEDQPRCRDIDPSNRLGTYFDMVTSPPDVDISVGNWTLDATTGVLTHNETQEHLTPPTFFVPSPSGSPGIRVYVVNNIVIGNATITNGTGPQSTATAILANGTIKVVGDLVVQPGAGASNETSCVGAKGFGSQEQANGACVFLGAGGGGGAVAGAVGGSIIDADPPYHAPAGPAAGTDNLEPLAGGCSGGGFTSPAGDSQAFGGPGGGALQLSSRKSIEVSGSIRAVGSGGDSDENLDCFGHVSGGGGGGGVLLEAPTISLKAMAQVSTAGGQGGAMCSTSASQFCGVGGLGGTGTTAPQPGANATFTTALPASTYYSSGGGGGGVGRVRFNTPTGTYSIDSSASVSAVVTTGTLRTR